MRKPLMALAVAGCVVLALVGFALPVLQGWIFLVLALYLLATEFESGRRWVTAMRRRWPILSRWMKKGRDHRWAPRHLRSLDDLTDPEKQDQLKRW
jgi:uncharacterized membrane protein YbaN (DUF454 family)